MNLLEYPCYTCLVRSICNNFECPMMEEYLTSYYKYATMLSASELSNFSETIPPILAKAINCLIKKERKFTYMYMGRPFIGEEVKIKNNYYMLEKTNQDEIKILSKF